MEYRNNNVKNRTNLTEIYNSLNSCVDEYGGISMLHQSNALMVGIGGGGANNSNLLNAQYQSSEQRGGNQNNQ